MIAVFAAAALALAGPKPAAHPFSFVVLGHIRGGLTQRLNPKLGEVLARVKALHPDFVVLTGDIIWGGQRTEGVPPRAEDVNEEWRLVDSALATLGVPMYRVPGNHDIQDVQSRDIWKQRYGDIPRVVTVNGSRLILLTSAFIPPNGDTTHMKYIGGVDIDSGQAAWLRRTLADTGFAHTFVFMHHLLWWEPEGGRWWREVHPMLAAAHVDGVFSGDYGPMKFSTMEKDGVRYWQASIELQTPIAFLQRNAHARLLSSQFDTFLEVKVADSAAVVVHTADEVSVGDFTPQRFRTIDNPPPPTLKERLLMQLDNPRRLAVLGAGAVFLLLAGFASGRRSARR